MCNLKRRSYDGLLEVLVKMGFTRIVANFLEAKSRALDRVKSVGVGNPLLFRVHAEFEIFGQNYLL